MKQTKKEKSMAHLKGKTKLTKTIPEEAQTLD